MDVFGLAAGFITNPIVTLVVGAILGIVFSEFLRRPKLKPTASSGGTGQHGQVWQLQVTNEPAFLGISLGETTLFGRQLHDLVRLGLPISRNRAKDCRAFLFDKDTGDVVSQRWAQVVEGQSLRPDVVSLESGESCYLGLIASIEEPEYFAYKPGNEGEASIEIPPEHQRFRDTHTFELRISHG